MVSASFYACCHCHLINFLSGQVLGDLLKDDEELCSAIEANIDDLPFDIFQALYYAYAVRERPDIVQLYNQYAVHEGSKADLLATSSITLSPEVQTDKAKKPLRLLHLKCKERRGSTFLGKGEVTSSESRSYPHQQPIGVMSMDSFLVFLQISKGTSNITLEDAKMIALQYDFHLQDTTTMVTRDPTQVSLKGYAHYLMSQEAGSQTTLPPHDMTQPLTSYFIASSHNTYLTGHQLYGDSSTAMYASVSCVHELLTSC